MKLTGPDMSELVPADEVAPIVMPANAPKGKTSAAAFVNNPTAGFPVPYTPVNDAPTGASVDDVAPVVQPMKVNAKGALSPDYADKLLASMGTGARTAETPPPPTIVDLKGITAGYGGPTAAPAAKLSPMEALAAEYAAGKSGGPPVPPTAFAKGSPMSKLAAQMVSKNAAGAMPAGLQPVGGAGGVPGAAGGMGGAAAQPKSWMDGLTPAEQQSMALQIKAMRDQGIGDEKIAEALQEEAAYKKNKMANSVEYREEYDAKMAEVQAEKEQYVEQALVTQQQMQEELANTKIESNRWWGSRETGEKIMAGLGIALSGFGAGLTGGPNTALEMIERSIDRDVDEQKANLSNKYAALAASKGLVAERVAAFNDKAMGVASAKLSYLQGLDFDIQAKAAQTNDEVAKANAEKMSALLGDRIGMAQNDFMKLAEQRAAAKAAAQMSAASATMNEQKKQAAAVFAANLDAMKERAKQLGGQIEMLPSGMPVVTKTNADGSKVILESGVAGAGDASKQPAQVQVVKGFSADGKPVFGSVTASDKESANKLKEAQNAYISMKANVDKLAEIHKNTGIVYDDDATKAEAESAVGQLITDYAVLKKMGAISEGDKKLIESVIPSKGQVLTKNWFGKDGAQAKIDALRKAIDNAWDGAMAGAGNAPDNLPTVAAPPVK